MCARLCSEALLKHWHILISTDIFPGMFGIAHFRDEELEAHTYSVASSVTQAAAAAEVKSGLSHLQATALYLCFMLPQTSKPLRFKKHTERQWAFVWGLRVALTRDLKPATIRDGASRPATDRC